MKAAGQDQDALGKAQPEIQDRVKRILALVELSGMEMRMTNQLELLWRREIAKLQEINGLYKYANKRRSFVKKYLMQSVPKEILKKQLLDILFNRDYSIFNQE